MGRKLNNTDLKPLLGKTTKPFLFYVLAVLMISVPVYYWVVDGIWKGQLDEYNKIVADKTAYELNRLHLSEEELKESLSLWNQIQPTTNIHLISINDNLTDSVYSIAKRDLPYSAEKLERFRGLSTVVYINDKPYRFTIETNIEETNETIAALTIVTAFFFLFIVIGLLLLNRRLSNKVWKPFQDTLIRLKNFKLNSQKEIKFEKTNTKEFEELNQSLKKLLSHNIATYKSQKEFTENASHELQTPLAILQNKLDILLQSEDLTSRQYHLAEEMNRALIRSARINKSLLLLAKIENNQFDGLETVSFDTLILQCVEDLQAHFKEKKIQIETAIHSTLLLKGNSILTETLINNLLINAIRHTDPGGSIKVEVSKSGFMIRNTGEKALDQNVLFKRFSRMSKNSSGSGLGLSIVKEICKFHGWNVRYEFAGQYHQFSILP